MKTTVTFFLMIMFAALNSCIRKIDVSHTPRYKGYIGEYRDTKRKYIVYEDVEPGAEYRRKFVGDAKVMTSPSAVDIVKHYGDANTYYKFAPKGSRYRVGRVIRRQDPSGTWDYVIGDVYLSGEPVQFRFTLGEIGINPNLHNNMP